MKKEKSAKRKFLTRWTVIVTGIAVLSGGVIIYNNTRQRAEALAANAAPIITLQKTSITHSLSVSGQADSESVVNVYSSLTSHPVQSVGVTVGDRVQAGTVLAVIDTTNLHYDITQAENNLANAQKSLETELQNNQNSITNAQNSLQSAIVSRDKQRLAHEKSLADLQEAEANLIKPFDTYTYDTAIQDATVNLTRRQEALRTAEADLAEAQTEFDSYTYQNAVTEAQITLDKRMSDLKEAEDALQTEQTAFDNYNYQNTINDAKTRLDRAEDDFQKLKDARTPEKDDRYITAENAVTDAQTVYDKALTDSERAQTKAVEDAEKALSSAQNAADDALRAYERAATDLSRAQTNAADANVNSVKSAQTSVDTARNAAEDAQRTYDKAVTDLDRAQEKAAEDNEKQLATAARNAADAEKSLASANLSVTNQQNALAQAQAKTPSNEANVANQQIALDKLLDQLAKAEIKAPAAGIITAVNVTEGTNPGGILFVIEDTEMLFVSAKVKEYNLPDISIGQAVRITTDATGAEVFDGEITYISPKAVSAAGATNVEFEIKAVIHQSNEQIKIGMNTFLEIVLHEKADVFTIPLSALITNEQGRFVRTEANDLLPVTIGIQTSTTIEIAGESLTEGLRIISGEATATPGQNSMPGMMGGFGGMR